MLSWIVDITFLRRFSNVVSQSVLKRILFMLMTLTDVWIFLSIFRTIENNHKKQSLFAVDGKKVSVSVITTCCDPMCFKKIHLKNILCSLLTFLCCFTFLLIYLFLYLLFYHFYVKIHQTSLPSLRAFLCCISLNFTVFWYFCGIFRFYA